MSQPHTEGVEQTAASMVEVLWRPGCPYCSALRRDLNRRGVPARWRNIWEDGRAQELVRAANNGNETVPTVVVGDRTLTNPRWSQLQPLLPDGPWNEPVGHTRISAETRRLLSWVPVVALLLLSFALEAAGHTAASWAVDPLALAAWWFTRPLRR